MNSPMSRITLAQNTTTTSTNVTYSKVSETNTDTPAAGNRVPPNRVQELLDQPTHHQTQLQVQPPAHGNVSAEPKIAKLSYFEELLEPYKMSDAQLRAHHEKHPPLPNHEQKALDEGFSFILEAISWTMPIGGALGITRRVHRARRAPSVANYVAPDLPSVLRGQQVSNWSITRNVTPHNANTVSQQLVGEFEKRKTLVDTLKLAPHENANAHAALAANLRQSQAEINKQLLITGHRLDRNKGAVKPLLWDREKKIWMKYVSREQKEPTKGIERHLTSGVTAENIDNRIIEVERLIQRTRTALQNNSRTTPRDSAQPDTVLIQDAANNALMALKLEKEAFEKIAALRSTQQLGSAIPQSLAANLPRRGQIISQFGTDSLSIARDATPTNVRNKLRAINSKFETSSNKLDELNLENDAAFTAKQNLQDRRNDALREIDEQLFMWGKHIVMAKKGGIKVPQSDWDRVVTSWISSIKPANATDATPINDVVLRRLVIDRYVSDVNNVNLPDRIAAASEMANRARKEYVNLAERHGRLTNAVRGDAALAKLSENEVKKVSEKMNESQAILEGAQEALEQLGAKAIQLGVKSQ